MEAFFGFSLLELAFLKDFCAFGIEGLFQFSLSEFPFAMRIAHRYAFGFFDMLVLDCGEESVKEARGETT